MPRGSGLQSLGYLQGQSPIRSEPARGPAQVFLIGNTARTKLFHGTAADQSSRTIQTTPSHALLEPTVNPTAWTRKELLKVRRSAQAGETRLLQRGQFDPSSYHAGPPRPTQTHLQCPAAHTSKLSVPVRLFAGLRGDRSLPGVRSRRPVALLTTSSCAPSEEWRDLMRGKPVHLVNHDTGTVQVGRGAAVDVPGDRLLKVAGSSLPAW